MTSTWLVLVLLSQAGQADSTSAEIVPPPHLASSTGGWRYLTRMEATGLALLPSGGVGGVESYAQLTPMLVVDGGEALGLNLGAPVRLRLAGGELGAGLVRREDWDSLSDWGQLVHALKTLHLYSGQVRWRFGRKLYAVAEGGTLLYAKPDGALHPGAYTSLSLGVDNAR